MGLSLIFLMFSLLIGAATWMTPIEYDGAYNFQVAQSLQENFSYQPRYIPTKIYDARVTTNGPLQYFMAGMIRVFGLDLGRSITLGTIAGLMAVIIFIYSRQSFFLYCLLLLFWPNFVWAHINFWGEVFSITMTMAGFIAWERWSSDIKVHKSLQDPALHNPSKTHYLWLSGLAFGVAIATKFMAAPAILLLLFCLVVYTLRDKPWPKDSIGIAHLWMVLFLIPYCIALIVFSLQLSASIIHSGGHLATIWPTLKLFIISHFQQAEYAATTLEPTRWRPQVESIPSLIVLLGMLLLLFRRHIVFLLPAIAIAGLLLAGHFNIRRIMTLMLPIMLLAAKEVHVYCPATRKWHTPFYTLLPIIGSGLILIIGSILCHRPPPLVKIISNFTHEGARTNQSFYPGKSRKDYNISLIPTIEALPGRIFTSGWYQFPEISLRTKTIFYDRFATENTQLLHGGEASFFLFDSAGPKDKTTEHDLCGKVLYRHDSLILCQDRPQ